MIVMVTGHRGYVGSLLAQLLARSGHDVIGLDSRLYSSSYDWSPSTVVDLAEDRCQDIRDVRPADFLGVDAVAHLAALSNDALGELDPTLTRSINFTAALDVARCAKESGVRRFVFSSSCSVYGTTPDGEVSSEASDPAPLSEYAISKVRAENMIHELASSHYAPVSLRSATAFGWSPYFRTDLVLNDFTAGAAIDGSIVVRSTGKAWRPFVHAADMAMAFKEVLEADGDRLRDEKLNVGSPAEQYTILELAEIVATEFGAPVVVEDATADDARSYRVSFEHIGRVLPEWSARWTARSGVQQMMAAIMRTGMTNGQYRLGYRRLEVIKNHVRLGKLGLDLRDVV